MLKSASLALLALVAAATVSAQTPNHTYFTSPLDAAPVTYKGGDKVYFSWNTACVAPSSTWVAADPKAAEVQLVNSNNSTNAFYVAPVTTIDCTANQGNTQWTVPEDKADPNTFYSLKIILGNDAAYSGKFKILSKNAAAPAPSAAAGGSTTGNTNAASGLVASVAVSGAALVASAAMMLL
ncbi:hypothetical protein BGZ83_003378 [Gryganskiella cystojenkinii]|nr:hypothetical protein BGZ83_003378 [Gryganskiella cystojenkinii]